MIGGVLICAADDIIVVGRGVLLSEILAIVGVEIGELVVVQATEILRDFVGIDPLT